MLYHPLHPQGQHNGDDGGQALRDGGGAPDVLLSRCTHILAGAAAPLTAALGRDVEAANASMAEQALRVLACGYQDIESLVTISPILQDSR